jgi:hypothetical protein
VIYKCLIGITCRSNVIVRNPKRTEVEHLLNGGVVVMPEPLRYSIATRGRTTPNRCFNESARYEPPNDFVTIHASPSRKATALG